MRDAPQLLCISPEMVPGFWPSTAPMIRAAIERTGLGLFEKIEADLFADKSLLWIAWNGRETEAAALTQIQLTDGGKVCVIVACGGADRKRWLPLLSQIESYAERERCERVRLFGRRGWLRALEGYSVSNVVLDKHLADARKPPRGAWQSLQIR